jgi:hypothetical protein
MPKHLLQGGSLIGIGGIKYQLWELISKCTT